MCNWILYLEQEIERCAFRLAADNDSNYVVVYEPGQITIMLPRHYVTLSVTSDGRVDQQNYGNFRFGEFELV